MSWDIISALGAIISAVAVVFSILYLARQIKQSTDLARAESQRELLNIAHLWHPLVTTPGLVGEFRNGLNDYESMAPDAQARFEHFLHPIVNHVESCYRMHRQGLLETESYERWVAGLISLINMPGAGSWWSRTKGMYGPDFVEIIDEAQAKSDKTRNVTEFWHFYAIDGGTLTNWASVVRLGFKRQLLTPRLAKTA